jgi:hypothetical protein
VTSFATPVHDSIYVSAYYDMDGIGHVEVPYDGDYDSYKMLPASIVFQGRLYGKVGHNSDRHLAYYNTRKFHARALPE